MKSQNLGFAFDFQHHDQPVESHDLAEHVAAKTALQNGAAELAERLLPKLVK